MKISINAINENLSQENPNERTIELSDHENPEYVIVDSSVSMHALLVKKIDLIKAVQALS